MYFEKPIEGKYIDLKCIDESDAEFTLELRQDPEFVKYLPKLDITIEQQKQWINIQQKTQDDYFWVVMDKKGNRLGTVGIFDIFSDPPKAGRLAIKGNALQNIEANYLAYKYGLDNLGLNKLWGFIYAENERAIRFAELFGGILCEAYEMDGRLVRDVVFKQPEFGFAEQKVRKMIYREK